ncbi:MAG: hypothetical protein P8Y38_09670 [Deltaproteobacteria bacterium]
MQQAPIRLIMMAQYARVLGKLTQQINKLLIDNDPIAFILSDYYIDDSGDV